MNWLKGRQGTESRIVVYVVGCVGSVIAGYIIVMRVYFEPWPLLRGLIIQVS